MFSQMRPRTSQLLELHVFYVPEEVWNFKLNTVPIALSSKFISAGFIREQSVKEVCSLINSGGRRKAALLALMLSAQRDDPSAVQEHPEAIDSDVTSFLLASGCKVSPHMTLRVLREKLGEYLGGVAVADKFKFLKCIGKKLAVVKPKQETELELEAFAPPYALCPELYLLPEAEYLEDIYPLSSSTPQRLHFNAEANRFGYRSRLSSLPPPKPNQSSHQLENEEVQGAVEYAEKEPVPVLHTSHKGDHKKRVQEKQTRFREKDQNGSSGSLVTPSHSNPADWESGKSDVVLQTSLQNHLSQDQKEHHTPKWNGKAKGNENHRDEQSQNNQSQNNQTPQHHVKYQKGTTELTNMENNDNQTGTELERDRTQDAGILKIIEEQTTEFVNKNESLQQYRTSKSMADPGEKLENQADENKQSHLPIPKEFTLSPTSPFPALSVNPAQVPSIQTAKNKMVEQLHQMKKDRRHMEKNREELIKKAKGLLEQNKLRRYQVREEWKKRYFETKKDTGALEEALNKLQQDLELYHQKLLLQLEARDSRKQPNNMVNSKNYTIIRITTVQHELDQLRRKLDNTKMKLIIEIKMRKQAAADLRALRAELTQKKIHSALIAQSKNQELMKIM